ncbi:NB-ARC domain-containing disease resistance protein [Zostera marina]|uniref:NB-ARC domain-containing disease resistance protein n=1 Tax=Zostera marina TaxID=29655 RepID=A0A0K9NQC2_ZOSMR|nr:NB-ARC domain-containing disease resistance protein [Zostera marina]
MVLRQVYVHLKLSYDYLESDNQKLCFLFCSLFPKDYPIQLNDLMYYRLGEGFVTCREKVSTFDRTLDLIDKLKSRGLLLDVEGRDEMFCENA